MPAEAHQHAKQVNRRRAGDALIEFLLGGGIYAVELKEYSLYNPTRAYWQYDVYNELVIEFTVTKAENHGLVYLDSPVSYRKHLSLPRRLFHQARAFIRRVLSWQ